MISFENMKHTTKPYYFFCPQDLIFQLKFKLKENNLEDEIIESVHGFAFNDNAAKKFPRYRNTKAWENLSKVLSKSEYEEAIRKTKQYFTQTKYPDVNWIGVIKTTIEPTYLQNLLLKFYGPTIDTDYAIEQKSIDKNRHEYMTTMLEQCELL